MKPSILDFIEPAIDWNAVHIAWDKFKALKLDDQKYNDLRIIIAHAICYDSMENVVKWLEEGINFYNSQNPGFPKI